jgi:4'-phosphopantetheinyl transferase
VFKIFSIQPGEILIYYIYLPEQLAFDSISEWLEVLDEEEKERLYRYRVEFKRIEYLVGRVLVKRVIADYLGVEMKRVAFEANSYGKLYLKDREEMDGGRLEFNLSHSGKMIVAGFMLGEELGVDVEQTRPDLVEIGERFFSQEEVDHILGHDGKDLQNQATCKIWTLKEAYIKAQGVGISSEILKEKTILGYPGWFFETFTPEPGYFVSVAVRKNGREEPGVKVRKVDLKFEV